MSRPIGPAERVMHRRRPQGAAITSGNTENDCVTWATPLKSKQAQPPRTGRGSLESVHPSPDTAAQPRTKAPYWQPRRQVSWLADHRHRPAFPVTQWQIVGGAFPTYSCGGSRGVEARTLFSPRSLLILNRGTAAFARLGQSPGPTQDISPRPLIRGRPLSSVSRRISKRTGDKLDFAIACTSAMNNVTAGARPVPGSSRSLTKPTHRPRIGADHPLSLTGLNHAGETGAVQ